MCESGHFCSQTYGEGSACRECVNRGRNGALGRERLLVHTGPSAGSAHLQHSRLFSMGLLVYGLLPASSLSTNNTSKLIKQ